MVSNDQNVALITENADLQLGSIDREREPRKCRQQEHHHNLRGMRVRMQVRARTLASTHAQSAE